MTTILIILLVANLVFHAVNFHLIQRNKSEWLDSNKRIGSRLVDLEKLVRNTDITAIFGRRD